MNKKAVIYIILVLIFLSSCSVKRGSGLVEQIRHGYYPYKIQEHVEPGYTQNGIASWYGSDFHGKKTADGEMYNMYAKTAAHKTLPFGTYVRVTNLSNHRETVVRINDRGPFVGNRIIDLSYAAARDLRMIGPGTARVKLVVLSDSQLGYSKKDIDTEYETLKTADKAASDNAAGSVLYSVQIASFRSLPNALRFRDKASELTTDVYVKKVILSGNVFYRVMAGTFSSKQEAVDFAHKNIVPKFGSFCISKK